MPEECLTDIELEKWPNLPPERANHHRSCSGCEEKVRNLVRPRFIRAAESVGVRRGLSAREILDATILRSQNIDDDLDDIA